MQSASISAIWSVGTKIVSQAQLKIGYLRIGNQNGPLQSPETEIGKWINGSCHVDKKVGPIQIERSNGSMRNRQNSDRSYKELVLKIFTKHNRQILKLYQLHRPIQSEDWKGIGRSIDQSTCPPPLLKAHREHATYGSTCRKHLAVKWNWKLFQQYPTVFPKIKIENSTTVLLI